MVIAVTGSTASRSTPCGVADRARGDGGGHDLAHAEDAAHDPVRSRRPGHRPEPDRPPPPARATPTTRRPLDHDHRRRRLAATGGPQPAGHRAGRARHLWCRPASSPTATAGRRRRRRRAPHHRPWTPCRCPTPGSCSSPAPEPRWATAGRHPAGRGAGRQPVQGGGGGGGPGHRRRAGRVRRAPALRRRRPRPVSTVDNLESPMGQAAVVLALEELGSARVGHFGVGPGAQRLLPPLAA